MAGIFTRAAAAVALWAALAAAAAAQGAPPYIASAWLQFSKLASPISATSSSAATQLPTGGNVGWLCNTGSNDAYVSFGTANTVTTSAATGSLLKASSCAAYMLSQQTTPPTFYTWVATISASGTTIAVETGWGTPPAALASSGGGGGGAVTIANGADVAAGSTTDSPCTLPATTTACTQIALSKAIGNVINSSTIPLGSGQNTGYPTSWLGVGCEFTTSPTTITTGNGSPLACDNANNLLTSVKAWAGGVLGAMANYGTSPGAVLVPAMNAFITNTPAFNQTQLNSVALGSPSNYGTSPGAVAVPGVNAFITNTVPVTGTFFQTTQPVQGAVNVTPTNCSGTITTGGTAQNAFAASATNHAFVISNLSTDPMWISFTTTAAIGATQSYLLAAGSSTSQGGSFASPLGFGMNTALSVIAATTSDKFSCTQW